MGFGGLWVIKVMGYEGADCSRQNLNVWITGPRCLISIHLLNFLIIKHPLFLFFCSHQHENAVQLSKYVSAFFFRLRMRGVVES